MWILCVFCVLFTGSAAQIHVCGKAPQNARIVGGADAPNGAWPWQVSIHRNSSHMCGGSLINNLWVLSAAHCVKGENASMLTVYIGRRTLNGSNPNEVRRNISQIIYHPGFSFSTYDNDMSLLKLDSTVNFTDYIRPVCLAASGSTLNADINVWTTGWGTTVFGGSLATNLQEVQVPIVGNRQCSCDYFPYVNITDNMLCAALEEEAKTPGDSGGPLVYKPGSVWIEFGVVSFGYQCALPGYPGIYSRVSRYEDWIKSYITENQPGFVSFRSNGTDSDLSVNCTKLNLSSTTAPPTTTTSTTKPTTTTPAQGKIHMLPPSHTLIHTSVVCGNAPLNKNLSAGASVSDGQWPWMVSIQKNQVHVCGGTLVSENAVLSDSSCLPSSLNMSEWSVVLGRLHQNGSNANEVRLMITNITRSNSSGVSNVVVLKLASKPTLSNYIQPICLDDGQNTFAEGTTCYSAGWSLVATGAQTLREIQTSIVSCGTASSANTLCTRIFTLQQGDYGGPLMCKVSGSWFQAVVLFNTNSTTRADMMTFEKVSAFKDFLRSVLGEFLSPAASTTAAPIVSTTSSGPALTAGPALLASHLLLALLGLLLFT
ncbi:hypothetical protein WMY93_001864 [Mugilogobius chulae]|uniref:Peptidase S1 domain-containing protein n=1 Tax=Mugilogobius chulae TaxID=88201 RepID=A0AAW0PRX1_9GOBI